jgi:hypothetical protein
MVLSKEKTTIEFKVQPPLKVQQWKHLYLIHFKTFLLATKIGLKYNLKSRKGVDKWALLQYQVNLSKFITCLIVVLPLLTFRTRSFIIRRRINLLATSWLVFPEIEESVDDWIHDGIDASKNEETSLNAFVQLLERLVVAQKPEKEIKKISNSVNFD